MSKPPKRTIGDVKPARAITLTAVNGETRIDSRLLSEHLGNRHKAVMTLLERYGEQFRGFGQLPFEKTVGERAHGGGNPERYALLNEDQAFFALSLSRNTPHVVNLKAKLVLAFREARQVADQRQTEYLPTYHRLHDVVQEVAAGSSNVRMVHLNFNKLVNKAVGIESGQRRACANLPQQAMLILAQAVAANALHGAQDHHEGYQRAKQSLTALAAAAALHGPSMPAIASDGGSEGQGGQGG
jgi:phage regulator Rha-like protein